jgi:hypothetical protein
MPTARGGLMVVDDVGRNCFEQSFEIALLGLWVQEQSKHRPRPPVPYERWRAAVLEAATLRDHVATPGCIFAASSSSQQSAGLVTACSRCGHHAQTESPSRRLGAQLAAARQNEDQSGCRPTDRAVEASGVLGTVEGGSATPLPG